MIVTIFKVIQAMYWLFKRQEYGQYSVRSVQAVSRAGANPYVTKHNLLHSYVTHRPSLYPAAAGSCLE